MGLAESKERLRAWTGLAEASQHPGHKQTHSLGTAPGELVPWLSGSVSFCSGFKSLRDSDGVDQLSSGQGVARPTRLHAMGKQVPPKKY